MHLHHELQRALANTKFDRSAPSPTARADEQPHRERSAAGTRGVRFLFGHRDARHGARTAGTLRTGQH
jgi:hypothetical protein